MADLIDVSNALVTLIAGVVYPNGIGQPSIAGVGVKVYAGWPLSAQLQADIAALSAGTGGAVHVSVYPRPEERNTTRYQLKWQPATLNTATLTLTIAGQTVTVGGAVPPASNPHNLVVLANAKPYVYAVQPADTLASIATALAALIAADIGGTAAVGAVITLPNTARLAAARIGVTGTSKREIGRQEKLFQIGIWADSPAHREVLAPPIDLALRGLTFITLADGSAGWVNYKRTIESDQFQNVRLFRRDLFYTVEYGTFQTEIDTQITQGQLNISAAPAGVTPYQPVQTVYD